MPADQEENALPSKSTGAYSRVVVSATANLHSYEDRILQIFSPSLRFLHRTIVGGAAPGRGKSHTMFELAGGKCFDHWATSRARTNAGTGPQRDEPHLDDQWDERLFWLVC